VAQLRRKIPQFEQTGSRVVLVGMGTPEESAAFLKNAGVSFPMISDPKRQLYHDFGLKMAAFLELLSPVLTFKALSTMARGHSVGLPIGDVRQLPGVFVINTGGRIVYSHVAKDAADHPDPERILTALRAMA
jgi:alkyl hydroperoxide reductase subunit AhpC